MTVLSIYCNFPFYHNYGILPGQCQPSSSQGQSEEENRYHGLLGKDRYQRKE